MKRTVVPIATFVVGMLLAFTLFGCTPGQIRAWSDWYAADPEGATAFVVDYAPSPTPSPAIGNCNSYVPLFEKYGLPVSTFRAIAWRESGCNHTQFTDDSDDLGGYLLGLNFRTANLRANWASWCGGTVSNLRYDVDRQVRCAAAAYQRMGLAPWR